MDHSSKVCYYAAGFATVFLLAVYVVSLIELLVKVPAFAFNVPCCVLLLALGGASRLKKDRSFAIGGGVFLASLLAGMLISSLVIDESYDGRRYQSAGIMAIPRWYNFFHEDSPSGEFGQYLRDQLGPDGARYITVFPKLTWVLGSNFVALTGSFGANKTINWLGLLITFGFAFPVLQSLAITAWRSRMLAAAITLNPISIVEIFTAKQDGFLSSLLMALACLLLWMMKNPPRSAAAFSAILTILIINTKTPGVIFAGIFIASAMLWCFLHKVPVWRLYPAALAVPCGFFLFGYAPFTQAMIRTGNPFDGVIGQNSLNFTEGDLYKISDRNPALLFFRSVFGPTIKMLDDAPALKIPGSVTIREIRDITDASRFGGFGPLFSLVIVLSIIAAIIAAAHNRSAGRGIAWCCLTVLAATLVHPAAWHARYVPHFYLFPLIPIIGLSALATLSSLGLGLCRLCGVILATNISFFSYSLVRDVILSHSSSVALSEICRRAQRGRLVIYDKLSGSVEHVELIRSRIQAERALEPHPSAKLENVEGVVFSIE